jgi:hypothetical protein
VGKALGYGKQLVRDVAVATLEMPRNTMRRDDRLSTLSQLSLLLIEACPHFGYSFRRERDGPGRRGNVDHLEQSRSTTKEPQRTPKRPL